MDGLWSLREAYTVNRTGVPSRSLLSILSLFHTLWTFISQGMLIVS